jgi:hypothetical protein
MVMRFFGKKPALPAEPPQGYERVSQHRYKEGLDLSGKDLISCLGESRDKLRALVPFLLEPGAMPQVDRRRDEVISRRGIVADEVHVLPHARQNQSGLRLLFADGKLIEMGWGFY